MQTQGVGRNEPLGPLAEVPEISNQTKLISETSSSVSVLLPLKGRAEEGSKHTLSWSIRAKPNLLRTTSGNSTNHLQISAGHPLTDFFPPGGSRAAPSPAATT